MRFVHCTRAALAIVVAASTSSAVLAQQPPRTTLAKGAASTFTIFVRAVPVGSEQIAVARTAEGWTITGSGRLGAPLDVVTRRLQVRYDANWMPIELTIDATVRGQAYSVRSTVGSGVISNEVTSGTEKATTTAMTNADVLLPASFFAPYEALAARLQTAPSGSTLSAFGPPQFAFTIRVGESASERIQTATQLIETRRTHITLEAPGALPLEAEVWADNTGRLLRVSIPQQALEIGREDIASVSARNVPISRPNDETARIPSNGFALAGTIAKPVRTETTPLPAVVFIGGSGPTDRDEYLYGIPILGQLAGAAADAGFITLRFDKRGVGQSGGRIESGALSDLAEDLRAAVKLLSRRKDVDPKRIAVVGHGEGGSVALIAASKDKGIAAVALLATSGNSGANLILEQQQHLLSRMTLTDAEKESRVELQKKINDAVVTGVGWDKLPPEPRRQADNLEYQSILTTDPAKVMPNVRKPILVLQGELDKEVAPVNADRLEALARKRKNAPALDLVRLPGVNHLLVAATTGEVDEYALLVDKHVSPSVENALVSWLRKTLAK